MLETVEVPQTIVDKIDEAHRKAATRCNEFEFMIGVHELVPMQHRRAFDVWHYLEVALSDVRAVGYSISAEENIRDRWVRVRGRLDGTNVNHELLFGLRLKYAMNSVTS